MTQDVITYIDENIWGVWFLAGAILVFWMQAGFTMVEAGFTRAKNAGNIIMKNFMDFCIGTIMFILIGASLLVGDDIGGVIGRPSLSIFTDYSNFDFSSFVFNLVFCATTATIVSGAMAERTKFSAYCIYSIALSALIYPIEAHWVWGGGWLASLGFHDFAGSGVIHMVGGICALIGASILGARIGKYKRNSEGKVIKVNAIPGHNLTLGALGVFILWLGWYGFNGAAATSLGDLASIFLTTTVAPAVATVTCMLYTWIKYKKPDVTMCMNAALAGLVAITAPCDVTDCFGSLVIGLVAGLLVVFGVWICDYKLHTDDPVGAVAVHMVNGVWGTLAVGLFATETAPGYAIALDGGAIKGEGIFYGGGFTQLGIQAVGCLTIAAWAAVAITIVFIVLNKTIGIRVSAEDEINGLDSTEHGLTSAYTDFMPAGNVFYHALPKDSMETIEAPTVIEGIDDINDINEMIEAKTDELLEAKKSDLVNITIIMKQNRFEDLKDALAAAGVGGLTVTQVLGCGSQKGASEYYRGVAVDFNLLPKTKIEIVADRSKAKTIIKLAKKELFTGHIGDGKIFVTDVEQAIRVRTGEKGVEALKIDK